MKLVFILLAICALGYYSWTSIFSADKPSIFSLPTSALPSVSSSPVSPVSIPSVPSSVSVPVKSDPSLLSSKTFVFKYRMPPASSDITLASSLDVSLAVDSVSRSVLIVGPVLSVDVVYRYLESIDIIPGSCSVRSWAVFVDKSANAGFDFVGLLKEISPTVQASTGSFGSGSVVLDLPLDRLSLTLETMLDGSTVEVVQRPHVQLTHGKTAHVESIQQVPIPSTTVSQGVSQTSIEFRKVGLQLDVTPYFLSHDRVALDVKQSNGLLGQSVTVGANEIPVISSQSVDSTVSLTVGQTVVLGGVSTFRERHSRGLLRDITERSEGTLYVVLSTYSDVPVAIDPDAAFDGSLLPPIDFSSK
jgi:hypothetical protein